MSKSSLHIRRIAISAVFLAIALALRLLFTLYIPLFGQNGVRINIFGIFTVMPALLFGPLYGAIVAGSFDLLGFFLRPSGTFLPFMTMAVTFGGFLRGFLWIRLRDRSPKSLRLWLSLFALLLVGFGLYHTHALNADGIDAAFFAGLDPAFQTDGLAPISRLLVTRALVDPAANPLGLVILATTGLITAGAFFLVLLGIDWALSRWLQRKGHENTRLLPLLITLVLSGVVVSTLNTIVLREMLFTAWQLLPFYAVWLPRIIVELITTVTITYFVAVLMHLLTRQPALRDVIE